MHQYLKSIGFGNIESRRQLKEILREVTTDFSCHELISLDEETEFCEYRKQYGDRIGIAVGGTLDEAECFDQEYYFPYLVGTGITSYADMIVERRFEKEAYLGICEDMKVGISLIFHLQNGMEYMREKQLGNIPKRSTSLTLSGMALSGMILLPIQKDQAQVQTKREETLNRMMLISAAKSGDQQAMESLTLDDMDTYAKVSRRLVKEDMFSIIDTYFMPYGVECDQYSIMGEIMELDGTVNEETKDELYIMKLNVNELEFDICVPKARLFGEPAVGRRFKGNIWLQGRINF